MGPAGESCRIGTARPVPAVADAEQEIEGCSLAWHLWEGPHSTAGCNTQEVSPEMDRTPTELEMVPLAGHPSMACRADHAKPFVVKLATRELSAERLLALP